MMSKRLQGQAPCDEHSMGISGDVWSLPLGISDFMWLLSTDVLRCQAHAAAKSSNTKFTSHLSPRPHGHLHSCAVSAVSTAVGRTWEPLWGCQLPQMPGGSLPGTCQTPCQRLTCHGGHVMCRHQSELHLHECHFPPVSRAFVGQPLLQFTSRRGCQALGFVHATPTSTCRSPSAPVQSHVAGVKGLAINCEGVMAPRANGDSPTCPVWTPSDETGHAGWGQCPETPSLRER